MLLNDVLGIRIRQNALNIKPTQETRCRLEAPVNELPYCREVPPIVRKYGLTQAASKCRSGNLTVPKAFIETMPARDRNQLLKVVDCQINSVDFCFLNVFL